MKWGHLNIYLIFSSSFAYYWCFSSNSLILSSSLFPSPRISASKSSFSASWLSKMSSAVNCKFDWLSYYYSFGFILGFGTLLANSSAFSLLLISFYCGCSLFPAPAAILLRFCMRICFPYSAKNSCFFFAFSQSSLPIFAPSPPSFRCYIACYIVLYS